MSLWVFDDFSLDMILVDLNSCVKYYVEIYTASGFTNMINKNTYVSLGHLIHNLVQVKTHKILQKPYLSGHYCTSSLLDLGVSLAKSFSEL